MELDNSRIFVDNFDFRKIHINIRRGAYRCIGAGSGRVVFDLRNGYVVKVARNRRGIGQNKAEYQISLNDDSGLFASIPAVSEGYGFLIMNKASRIKNMSLVWNYFNVKNSRELFQLQKLQEISEKHDLLLIDFIRATNWGEINGKPVIVDYGYTKEVCRRYYMPLRWGRRFWR